MARKCGGARSETKSGIDPSSVPFRTRYIRRVLAHKNDHRRRVEFFELGHVKSKSVCGASGSFQPMGT